jgi:hypothetical protein
VVVIWHGLEHGVCGLGKTHLFLQDGEDAHGLGRKRRERCEKKPQDPREASLAWRLGMAVETADPHGARAQKPGR